jgi:hypothetical protein
VNGSNLPAPVFLSLILLPRTTHLAGVFAGPLVFAVVLSSVALVPDGVLPA